MSSCQIWRPRPEPAPPKNPISAHRETRVTWLSSTDARSPPPYHPKTRSTPTPAPRLTLLASTDARSPRVPRPMGPRAALPVKDQRVGMVQLYLAPSPPATCRLVVDPGVGHYPICPFPASGVKDQRLVMCQPDPASLRARLPAATPQRSRRAALPAAALSSFEMGVLRAARSC